MDTRITDVFTFRGARRSILFGTEANMDTLFRKGHAESDNTKCNHRSVPASSRNEFKPDVCRISLLMHPVSTNRFRSYFPQRSGAQCQLQRSDVDVSVSCVPTCSRFFSHARHCGEAHCRHVRPQAPKRGGAGVCQNGHNL